MDSEDSPRSREIVVRDLASFLQIAKCEEWTEVRPDDSNSYRLALGQEAIELGIIEFRILLFLASKPYHAFTRSNIAAAVSTEENPVTKESVDQHVASLVEQLSVFHDYVQSVPHIGYRFKA